MLFRTGRSGIGTGPHLDFRVQDIESGEYLHPAAYEGMLRVGGKPLSEQFRMTSDFGPRDIGIGSKYHRGRDYATPEGTEVEVAGATFARSWYDEHGGGNVAEYEFSDPKTGRRLKAKLLHGADDVLKMKPGGKASGAPATYAAAGGAGASSQESAETAAMLEGFQQMVARQNEMMQQMLRSGSPGVLWEAQRTPGVPRSSLTSAAPITLNAPGSTQMNPAAQPVVSGLRPLFSGATQGTRLASLQQRPAASFVSDLYNTLVGS